LIAAGRGRERPPSRARVVDDALKRAVERGLDQLLLMGAGYDSRPYRLPGVRALRVFEVDHPATEAVKRRVIQRRFGEEPGHVRFVAIDFDRQELGSVMAHAGIARGQRTYTIWEGVLAYLRPEAVDATLRWAGEISCRGSEISFTYLHRGLLDGSRHFPHAQPWVDSVRAVGEPFVFGLDPRTLDAYLADRGWRLLPPKRLRSTSSPATGRSVDVMALTVFHFHDGIVTENWTVIDQFSLFQQLGALPHELKPAQMPEPAT
jgi:methyltransferase (TIGR00027 family)